jgi:mRNA-degrading endonuclease RelE of RelBE toxin-antitoxin system
LRLRIGDWRVIFELDTVRREVTILALAHRRDVYRS